MMYLIKMLGLSGVRCEKFHFFPFSATSRRIETGLPLCNKLWNRKNKSISNAMFADLKMKQTRETVFWFLTNRSFMYVPSLFIKN